MLNLTPAVCSGLVAALATPETEAAPGFAQVLDQASIEQGVELRVELPDLAARLPTRRPDHAARGLHRVHDAAPLHAAPMRTGVEGLADADAEAAAETPVETLPPTPADTGESSAASQAATPADLAAWLSTLPLPRPAPPAEAPPETERALGALAAPRAEAATTIGNAGTATPHAMQVLAEVGARKPGAPAAPATEATEATAPHAPARPVGAPTSAAAPAAPAERRPDGAAAEPKAEPKAGGWLQALAAAREPAADAPRRGEAPAGSAPPPLPANAVAPPPLPPQNMPPLQAEVQAEVGSRAFAPALGSQLSVLVRDGIEHAQLKLNPAELGPIEVRISVDGALAQVDFSAAHAHTRQALQEAVPALAGALREQGLTLTGGGVFEQPRESRGEARQDAPRGGPAGGEPSAEARSGHAPAARAPRARGVVDLYA